MAGYLCSKLAGSCNLLNKFLLLKFSNILALCVAAWHRKVWNVTNLARKLVVAWTRRLEFPITCHVGSLARTKAELGRFVLERFSVVVVVSRARHDELHRLRQVCLELNAHGEVGTGLLSEGSVWIVGAATWDVQC